MNVASVMDRLNKLNHVSNTRFYPMQDAGEFTLPDGATFRVTVKDNRIFAGDDVTITMFMDFDGLLNWLRGYSKAYRNALRRVGK